MNPKALSACPCCGYKTLPSELSGVYPLCPICCWEADGNTENPGSNQLSLRQAQRNFIAIGACEPMWLKWVRSPTNDDEKDPQWQTLDEKAERNRLELIEKIALAFKDVTLEDGVSLHQARAFDEYSDGEEERKIDANIRWQAIPDEWIQEFFDVFSFMDIKGLRHAMPAYMTWCLKVSNSEHSRSFEVAVEYLSVHRHRRFWQSLNENQQQVISEFLEFVEAFAES